MGVYVYLFMKPINPTILVKIKFTSLSVNTGKDVVMRQLKVGLD